MVCVCVLLYGNNRGLADRCLGSICEDAPDSVDEIRVGMNEVTPGIHERAITRLEASGRPWSVYRELNDRNVLKYPMMRRMFYGDRLINSQWVMWFDDDSFIRGDRHQRTRWWYETCTTIRGLRHDVMLGSIYTMPFKGGQRKAIKAQSWYCNKPWVKDRRGREAFRFCTGGWWMAPISLISRLDYPIMELHHQGGDRLLGEMCRQNGVCLRQISNGVAINADKDGRESKALQRGVKEPALWETWDRNYDPDLSHHDWQLILEQSNVRT